MERSERRGLSQGLIITVVAIAVLLGGFGLIADEVIEGNTLTFDDAVIAMFREPGNPADPLGPVWVQEAVRDITGLGSFSVLGLLVAAVVIYFVMDGKRREAAF
ncbi:MAG: Membrane-associated phospholipid phosphatase, partial [Devosia sp.]|nr:Membrane-associated phospholipid phosphatase [Devosia sp.]